MSTLAWTALVLAVLAAALAWPVPALLDRCGWTRRDPGVALLCWQAVGLAGGLSIIGALLVHGLSPWGGSLPGALLDVATGRGATDPVRGDHWVALTLAVALAGELLGVLVLSGVRTARTRARHRELLELVTDEAGRGVPVPRLLDHPAPVAFCVPGSRPLVVLSSGMLAELDDDELAAVLAHERAHLRERHHLLLLPFVAWEAALPVLPAAARAHEAVATLVEMRADDVAAAGGVPRDVLARAVVAAVGSAAAVPSGALAAGAGSAELRVRRLLTPPEPLGVPGRALALAGALALLLVPTALLVLPAL
ncbi:M48 family metalloprotease [Rhodococcus aerolatus]